MNKNWEVKKLDEIIESKVLGLTRSSNEQSLNKKFKYVKMDNITRDNRFDFSKYVCVDATQLEVEKYNLKKGDFLFNTRNSYELVGKTCVFEGNSGEVVLFNNNIIGVTWLNHFFASYLKIR